MIRMLRGCLFGVSLVPLMIPLSSRAEWPVAVSDSAHMRPLGYVCARTSGPILLDGQLDELTWKKAAWTSDFTDIEGAARGRPAFRTRAKMLWDDSCFYIGAELEEPHVWGTLRMRDTVIFYDNDFELFIDPNGDNHEYYEFEMNALNTGWDLFLPIPYRDGGKAVDRWDIIGLRTAVCIRGTLNNPADIDTLWCVEIAIPWKALAEHARVPSPPREGDAWRVNFSRVEWDVSIVDGFYRKVPGRPEHNWVWSPQGVIDMHRPERWGYVQFSEDPGVPFVPDPAWPVREALMEIYYAQVKFRSSHHRWASALGELELPASVRALPIHIEAAESTYRASIDRPRSDGSMERWHVNQESRLWSDSQDH